MRNNFVLNKNEFRGMIDSMGLLCRYSGKLRVFFVYGQVITEESKKVFARISSDDNKYTVVCN